MEDSQGLRGNSMNRPNIATSSWTNVVVLALAGLGGLGAVPLLNAQDAPRPLINLFGPAPKKAKTEAPSVPLREDTFRLLEILIELAWLSDPITFPYYIEARVEGPELHVRGNVPSRGVREQALKLARLNSPMPVKDLLKENPRLAFRPVRLSPDRLQKVAVSGLREALPKQAKGLQVRCSADGRVAVLGPVDSFEEKLAISQTLRRLHGCTVVTNLTNVASDPDGSIARSLTSSLQTQFAMGRETGKGPASVPSVLPSSQGPMETVIVIPSGPDVPLPVPGSNSTIVAGSSPVGQIPLPNNQVPAAPNPGSDDLRKLVTDYMAQRNSKDPNPKLLGNQPIPVVGKDAPKKDGPPPNLALLKKKLEAACPGAKEIRLIPTGPGELRVEIQARPGSGNDQLADQVFAVKELIDNYRLDLRITLP
jgi:hypothetical protein